MGRDVLDLDWDVGDPGVDECQTHICAFHYMQMTLHLFFFFNPHLFIYLFFAVLGLRFCAKAFSSCGKRGATLHRGARASHYRDLSCCGAQAPDAQAQ